MILAVRKSRIVSPFDDLTPSGRPNRSKGSGSQACHCYSRVGQLAVMVFIAPNPLRPRASPLALPLHVEPIGRPVRAVGATVCDTMLLSPSLQAWRNTTMLKVLP